MAGPKISVAEALDTLLPLEIRTAERFDDWYEHTFKVDAVLAVHRVREEVERALKDEAERIAGEEGLPREIWVVTAQDAASLVKHAVSARSKVGRWLRKQVEDEAFPLRDRRSLAEIEACIREFPDLGRFRVTCTLFVDLERAWRLLLGLDAGASPRVVGAATLLGRYRVEEVKDYVTDLALRHPARGHRARQFKVQVHPDHSGGASAVWVEIQLMTRLQEAWDRRNHPIYEYDRDGGELPDLFKLTDVALAETLFVMDRQAVELWTEFLEWRRRPR